MIHTLLNVLFVQIELNVGVPDSDPNFDLRYNALFLVGFHPSRVFKIVHTELPFKVCIMVVP